MASTRWAFAPGVTDHQSAKGEGTYQPSCECHVERGAGRLARHVRERLVGLKPVYQTGTIPTFYLMRFIRPKAGDQDKLTFR